MNSGTRPLTLITGANQGVGRAVAQILASKHSHHVLVGSRSLEAGEKVASELRDAGYQATGIQLDLDSEASLTTVIEKIEKDFGYLDVLVNNAGILVDLNPTLRFWDMLNSTFSTNVIGPAFLTEKLLPLLRKAKAGPPRIVFVTSIMGSLEKSTDKNSGWYNLEAKAYDASKAAVNMLMINYARILDGVGKVNAVCPGYVNSSFTRYDERGHSPEVGAAQIVMMATDGEETMTFSDKDKSIPW